MKVNLVWIQGIEWKGERMKGREGGWLNGITHHRLTSDSHHYKNSWNITKRDTWQFDIICWQFINCNKFLIFKNDIHLKILLHLFSSSSLFSLGSCWFDIIFIYLLIMTGMHVKWCIKNQFVFVSYHIHVSFFLSSHLLWSQFVNNS